MINPEQVPELLEQLRPFMLQVVEVQLKDWQDNPTSGAWVAFRLPDADDLKVYKGRDRSGRNARAGQRYTMMLVELNDDDVPIQQERTAMENQAQNPEVKPMKLSQMAGMLCADEKFRAWIAIHFGETCANKDEAAQFLRDMCGVLSRADLETTPEAAATFRGMVSDYEEFKIAQAAGDASGS